MLPKGCIHNITMIWPYQTISICLDVGILGGHNKLWDWASRPLIVFSMTWRMLCISGGGSNYLRTPVWMCLGGSGPQLLLGQPDHNIWPDLGRQLRRRHLWCDPLGRVRSYLIILSLPRRLQLIMAHTVCMLSPVDTAHIYAKCVLSTQPHLF